MAISRDEFEALYRANAADILGYLRRRGVRDEAADLLAETFLVAWRRRGELPGPEGQRAWLFGTARRLGLAHFRRPITTTLPEHASGAWSESDSTPGLREAVAAALERLSESDRELLTLTIWEGLRPAEAASVIGILPTAARVRLHRARQRLAADPTLRRYLGKAEQTGPRRRGELSAFIG